MLEEYHKIPKEKLKYAISSINFPKAGMPASFLYGLNTLIYHNIVIKDKYSDLIGSKISDAQVDALKLFNRKNMAIITSTDDIYLYNPNDNIKSAIKEAGYKLLDNNLLDLNSDKK